MSRRRLGWLLAVNKEVDMGNMKSKRAELLRPLLLLINSGKYDEVDGYMVFGASSVWEMIESRRVCSQG